MNDFIRLTRICTNGRYGITRGNGNGNYLFSPGIAGPLPGWDWLLNRDHPHADCTFSLVIGKARFSATVNPDAHNGRIIKEICNAGLARR